MNGLTEDMRGFPADLTPIGVEVDGQTLLVMCDIDVAGMDGVIQLDQLAVLRKRNNGTWYCTNCKGQTTCAHMSHARPVLDLPDLRVLRHEARLKRWLNPDTGN
jgi:ketosteroid isomerase-like protein